MIKANRGVAIFLQFALFLPNILSASVTNLVCDLRYQKSVYGESKTGESKTLVKIEEDPGITRITLSGIETDAFVMVGPLVDQKAPSMFKIFKSLDTSNKSVWDLMNDVTTHEDTRMQTSLTISRTDGVLLLKYTSSSPTTRTLTGEATGSCRKSSDKNLF